MPTDQDIIIAVAAERFANRENEKSWKYRFRDYDIVDLRSGTSDIGGNEPKIHIAPEDFDKCAKTEDELISALGRKWKTIIPSLGQFCSYCRGHTHDGCLPLPNGEQFTFRQIAIACTNKMLCSMFGHPRKVNRLIGKALETGLLVRLTQTYRFGSRNKEYNHSYLYAYNGTVEGLIRATCRNHKITIPLIVANMEESTALLLTGGRSKGNGVCRNPEDGDGRDSTASIPSLVDRFAERLGLPVETVLGFSLANPYLGLKRTEDWKIKELTTWKYKELVEPRMITIASMNFGLRPDEQIRFEPNVKRDARGYASRVGWRATSSIVSFKAHENGNPNYKGRWRKDYLAEHFGGRGYLEYDVRASIYQISHLVNFGEWLGNRRDPYEDMFGGSFPSKEDRAAYKDFCMAMYFDTPKQIFAHNRRRLPECLRRFGKEKLIEAIFAAKSSMKRLTGPTLFNEVFLHESLLYIDFVHELRMRQRDVVQIYDGFYIDQTGIGYEELDELMLACANSYYVDYCKWKQAQRTAPAKALTEQQPAMTPPTGSSALPLRVTRLYPQG